MPTVLKVTTGCSVAAFAAQELCMLLARRTGIPCEVGDVECGERDGASELNCYIPFRINSLKNGAYSYSLALS
jgi:hypothetical protein